MATKILINAIRIGGIGQLWPGSSYDDTQEASLVALIQVSGGLLWDAGDATVADAAARALAVRGRAGPVAEAESIMQSAVQASQSASITGQNTVSSTVATVQTATTGLTVNSGGGATLTRGVHEAFVYPPLAGVALATVQEDTAGGTISAQPTHARTIDVVFAAGWEGGDITLDGVAPDGTAQSETYTSPGIGGGTVAGIKAFATLSAMTNSAQAGTTDLATAQAGGKLAVGGPVSSFLFCAVDGVREAFGSSSAANGTFSTTTALDGTQLIEVWYAQSQTVAAHTHAVTDAGHTHTGNAHTHTLS